MSSPASFTCEESCVEYSNNFNQDGEDAANAGAQTGTTVALPTGWTGVTNSQVNNVAKAAPQAFSFGIYYGQIDQGPATSCDPDNFHKDGNWALGIIETATQGKNNYLTLELKNDTGIVIAGLDFSFTIKNLWSRFNEDDTNKKRAGDAVCGLSVDGGANWTNLGSSSFFKSTDFEAGGCSRYAVDDYSESFTKVVENLAIDPGDTFLFRFARSGGGVPGHNSVPSGYQNKNMGIFLDDLVIKIAS